MYTKASLKNCCIMKEYDRGSGQFGKPTLKIFLHVFIVVSTIYVQKIYACHPQLMLTPH